MANKQYTVPTGSTPGSGGGGGGSGTVTSVAMTGDGTVLNTTVPGSPVTTAGTLAPTLVSQTANKVLAGPTSGGATAPTFRSLVSGDLPAGTGTVTSVTFTGDGTVLSSTPSSAVTTTGTLTAALANAAGGTVLGRAAGTTGAPAYTTAPVLGIAGTSTGTIGLTGITSGTATITAQATAGTPTITLPNASGTVAVSASSPLVLSATTGALTAPTAVTSAASLTNNAVVLGGGGQATSTQTFLTTDGAAKLTVGVAGGGNGAVALAGNTSGTATITAPAVAGTTTNPIVSSNTIQVPNGTATNPSINAAVGANYGWGVTGGGINFFARNGTNIFAADNSTARVGSGQGFAWTANSDSTSAADTAFIRQGVAVVTVTNSGFGNRSGLITAGNSVLVTSNFTTAANTNFQTITGLSITVPATAINWNFHCHLAYSQGTGNDVVTFGVQAATNNPTNIFAQGTQQITVGPPATFTTGILATLATTTATAVVSGTPGATGTNYVCDIYGTLENPASANTFNIVVKTNTAADAVTILRGSYLSFTT